MKPSNLKEKPTQLKHGEITNKIIQVFYQVYNKVGIGFDKDVYVNSLFLEIKNLKLSVNKTPTLNVEYNGQKVGEMTVDLIVENKVLVEVFNALQYDKTNEQVTYNKLRASNLNVGLILNFGVNPEFKRKEKL